MFGKGGAQKGGGGRPVQPALAGGGGPFGRWLGWLPWRKPRGAVVSPRLIDDGVCSGCGYDLEGLASWRDDGAVCPECGIPMVRARLGSDLPSADPGSLRLLARGMRFVSLGVLTALGSVLLGSLAMLGLVSLLDAITGIDYGDSVVVEAVFRVLTVGGPVVGFALWCVGWRRVSVAFEDRRLAGSRPGVPAALRVAVLCSVGAMAGAFVFAVFEDTAWGFGLSTVAALLMVSFLFATATLGLWLLRGLAIRANASRARAGTTQLLVTSPLLVVGPAVMGYSNLFGGVRADRWQGVLVCVGLLWGVSFIGFVDRLAKVVRSAVVAQGDGTVRAGGETDGERGDGAGGEASDEAGGKD